MMITWNVRSLKKRTFAPGEYIGGWEKPEVTALRLAKRAPGSTRPPPETTTGDDGLRYVEDRP